MNDKRRFVWITAIVLVCVSLSCDKQTGASKPRPSIAAQESDPHADDAGNRAPRGKTSSSAPAPYVSPRGETASSPDDAARSARDASHALELDGLTLTVPEGWVRGDIAPGPFAAVAVFELAKTGGETDDAQVRITHFPGMKGKDDLNIRRWLGQVTRKDGASYSRDEANLIVKENGNVRIKTIDLEGNVKATMRAAPRPNSRMIAAIVDHPKGPHFVVATGGAATMKKWEPTIRQFLDSASVPSR